jgi:hypothetical protein
VVIHQDNGDVYWVWGSFNCTFCTQQGDGHVLRLVRNTCSRSKTLFSCCCRDLFSVPVCGFLSSLSNETSLCYPRVLAAGGSSSACACLLRGRSLPGITPGDACSAQPRSPQLMKLPMYHVNTSLDRHNVLSSFCSFTNALLEIYCRLEIRCCSRNCLGPRPGSIMPAWEDRTRRERVQVNSTAGMLALAV